MNDNHDLSAKIQLRNSVFRYLTEIDSVIDYFCGQCVISNTFWSNIANKVIAIDKKPQQEPINNNIDRLIGDNKSLILLSRDIKVIDCDAYGLVMPFIQSVINSSTVDKLIFFTDGTPTRQKKFFNAEKQFKAEIEQINPDYIEYQKNGIGSAYYGYLFKYAS